MQSGLLTNRSRDLRETIKNISANEGLHSHSINVISDKLNTAYSHSKLIKTLLMTPNLGRDFENLNKLELNKYDWMIQSKLTTKKSENYQIIARENKLSPWSLIKENM